MYQEIAPSKELHKVIDAFWVFSQEEVPKPYKILPDNCTDLIYDLGQHKAYVSGTMTTYQVRALPANSTLIGVRLQTEKFALLTSIPLTEIKNRRVDLAQLFPHPPTDILDSLQEVETFQDKINYLESFVLTALQKLDKRQDPLVESLAQGIRAAKGNISMRDLALAQHISIRQLERRFKQFMGLTLKEFSSIVRFHFAKKTISNSPQSSLLEIAFATGFYDHAHMNYEFKRLSGENPSFYR